MSGHSFSHPYTDTAHCMPLRFIHRGTTLGLALSLYSFMVCGSGAHIYENTHTRTRATHMCLGKSETTPGPL